MKLHLIAGARPNFMKIAPLWRGLMKHPVIRPSFVHTVQQSDEAMSSAIWRELGLPDPDHVLSWKPSENGDRVAEMMRAYGVLCDTHRPDAVLVVGDVNSSCAAALVASEMGIPLVHLEAGLRCFDSTMPEEQNRVVIDHRADLLLTSSKDANENLFAEGISPEQIRLVGNIMIDTLVMMKTQIAQEETARKIGLVKGRYVLVTLHRQGNVDDPARLRQICAALTELAARSDVCFVLHPRTEKRLSALGLLDGLRAAGVRLLPPMGYVGFTSLMQDAGGVVTDSGGVQEETTCLGVPCLTLRNSTERPITITQGTNGLVEVDRMIDAVMSALSASDSRVCLPADIPLWDGKTSERVIHALEDFLLP
ncbi:UDP-N-acetylglucosamine 2-epimerase (non-hydrolyzing) [Thalassospira sp. HF15]|uniref:non-hydrolyzing UDP-N-acetylglucosamine 2-epimerase n=1 Tax=Thalassospira sp. HF15 TaxID=2722755 RepID=UPI0014317182|nr:UDP-N-acetylglucosamine 2-epimerase (non-hydrolyzing) [Thalassospira sp. HF15]NIY77348.1 UDP-N-acetylglucosamine 2-epimerase (non-hydrolyzing) [Thalassospira sp. HF15]